MKALGKLPHRFLRKGSPMALDEDRVLDHMSPYLILMVTHDMGVIGGNVELSFK